MQYDNEGRAVSSQRNHTNLDNSSVIPYSDQPEENMSKFCFYNSSFNFLPLRKNVTFDHCKTVQKSEKQKNITFKVTKKLETHLEPKDAVLWRPKNCLKDLDRSDISLNNLTEDTSCVSPPIQDLEQTGSSKLELKYQHILLSDTPVETTLPYAVELYTCSEDKMSINFNSFYFNGNFEHSFAPLSLFSHSLVNVTPRKYSFLHMFISLLYFLSVILCNWYLLVLEKFQVRNLYLIIYVCRTVSSKLSALFPWKGLRISKQLLIYSSAVSYIKYNCFDKRFFDCGKGQQWIGFMILLAAHGIEADQQSAPHFVVQPSFSGGIVAAGQGKILQCQAVGIPPPDYRWTKNGIPLGDFSSDPLLRLAPVTKNDSGDYQCVARNAAGAVFSEKTSLTVAYMMSDILKENLTVTVEKGQSVVLSPPEVNSVPPPTVTWQRVGQGRLQGKRYFTTSNNSLVILSSKVTDSGHYQATLTNTQVGVEVTGGFLHVVVNDNNRFEEISPEIVIPPKDSVFEQGVYPAVLECVVNARPVEDLEIIWMKDDVELPQAQISYLSSPWNMSVNLLNVGPMHEGVYECVAQLKNRNNPPVTAKATVIVYVGPTITDPPSSETVSEIGHDVILSCGATGNPQPNITWFRDSKKLSNDHTNNRYELQASGSLKISNLMTSDSGIFQCVVENNINQVSASTWLHVKTFSSKPSPRYPVLIPSPPVFIKSPDNTTVLDGMDAQISCTADGAPAPNTTWIFNDTDTVHSVDRVQILETGSLLIASVEPEDFGKYTCTRANRRGEISASAYLFVLVRTQITQPPVDTKVILSSTAELQCKVSHDPIVPYIITWYFGNTPLKSHPDGRVQVLEDGTLQIRQARNTDVGTYTCSVMSSGGNESRSAQLDVIELPYPPNNVKAELLNTVPKSVNVTWTKSFDGNSPITKYLVQMRIVPEEVAELDLLVPWVTAKVNITGEKRYVTLTNLKPASRYQFRVSAVNGVGEGSPSPATSPVDLPPEPPSSPPVSVLGGARSANSIMLQWQPPPEEDRNGKLLGYIIRYKLAGYLATSWEYHNISNVAQTTFLLEDLIVWQRYEIQVASYNNMGVGVYSDSIYIRTHEGVPQSSPTNLEVEAVNSTAVHIQWLPPDPQLINGINQGYKIEAWAGPSDEKPVKMQRVAPSPIDPLAKQETLMSGLEKYTQYNITVLCFTSAGNGPRSASVQVTTEQDTPEIIGSLKFEDILDSSVRVIWTPPKSNNGILEGYTIKYYIKNQLETALAQNVSADINVVLINNLQPVTAYTFEIFAWTYVGPGPSRMATIQSGIPPVLPGPPSKLAVSNIGATSVMLQFTPGFDGNSSIIKWSVEAQTIRNETWGIVYEVADSQATTITVQNLVPFTQYRLRLMATNVVGRSNFSEPTMFFQTLQAPPSHAPYNVTIRAVNANALRVRWTPLRPVEWYGIPRGYNISFRPHIDLSSSYRSVILEDHNENSHVLVALEEFTEYEVYMQAFNDVGSSEPSPLAVERTRESFPSQGPSDVQANVTSSTTIVVEWREVPKPHQNGIIEGYKVYYGSRSVPFQYKTIEKNNTFTTTLTQLRKYTLYNIQVLAYTRVGDGALSVPPVSIQTLEDVPGEPSNISFPDVTTTTVRLIWDSPEDPNGEIIAYRVSYRRNSSLEGTVTKDLAATERTLKIFNLNPETYYHFTVTAQTNEGWGKTAHAMVLTTNNREAPQAPSAPQISSSQIQSRQVTFSWTPGRDGFAPLRYYTVQLAEGNASWKTIPVKVDPLMNSYTVVDLKPFTSYKFRIQATNDIGSSSWSPESKMAQTLPDAPEDPPRFVTVTPYTPTSIRVKWEPIDDNAWNGGIQNPGYKVEYCLVSTYAVPQSTDCPNKQVTGTKEDTVSIDNLEQDKIYEVKVYAYNNQGSGPSSQPVTIYVGEAVPTGSPQDVKVSVLSSTEIEVSWKPPLEAKQNGDLLGYKIFYKTLELFNTPEQMEAFPVSTLHFTLVDLKKYTKYSVQILAFNPAGDGPRSPAALVKTKEDLPGPPGQLVFSDITMTSLNVSWLPPQNPNGEITGYLVTYETVSDDKGASKQVIQKVKSTYLKVNGLGEMLTYSFRVRAETFGYGPETSGNVTTGPQEGSPGTPKSLTLHKTHTSVTLQWRNGRSGTAPILGYLLEFKQLDSDEERWTTLVSLNSGPQLSYTISYQNLLPSAHYIFRIFARNKYGISLPAMSDEPVDTPSELFLEYRQKLPFYREIWFLVMLAAVSVIIIIMVIAILCVKSKTHLYKREAQKSMQEDHISMNDEGFATFELRQSRRGTLRKNSLSRKSNGTLVSKPPPRPSPGSITYSDDEDIKGYDENGDSSSLTEKPSEISSTDSQATESDQESEPKSFVNHYANVNDTLRQSWRRQRPVKPPSYTDSEPEGSVAVSLNGGHIIMNNMAGSRAPLPGFSSFV
ncbi:sidekick cell adhesion molecule isoform X1 [Tachypleus tridentatus]|uniref:sidekick cell adhesion molecule isoform X1 n=1 Tax=Tachypleus tridentatus TaxID=6853 RepID=UPI003FD41DE2